MRCKSSGLDCQAQTAKTGCKNNSYNGSARDGSAAWSKPGRLPRRQSPYKVNWETTRTDPPISRRTVHFAIVVRENPQAADLAGQPVSISGGVVMRDAKKNQETLARSRAWSSWFDYQLGQN